jgi:hypothetical protein
VSAGFFNRYPATGRFPVESIRERAAAQTPSRPREFSTSISREPVTIFPRDVLSCQRRKRGTNPNVATETNGAGMSASTEQLNSAL